MPCSSTADRARLKDTQHRYRPPHGQLETRYGKWGRTMSGQHASDQPADKKSSKPSASEQPEDRGRYVEGSYGKAGVELGHVAGSEEGSYVEGDYGDAGTEDAKSDGAAGRMVEADYGSAGEVPGHADNDPKGEYITGDYGDAESTHPES